MLTSQTVLVIGVALSGIVALMTPKSVRAGSFFGGLITTFGVVSLMSGRVVQEWDGGSPVKGPLAVVFSLILIAIGIYLLLFALFNRSDGAQRNDNDKV